VIYTGKGTLVSAADGKIIQIKITRAAFLTVEQTYTFTITDKTSMLERKPSGALATTLAGAGINIGDPVAFIYETLKSPDGTYHLRSLRYDD